MHDDQDDLNLLMVLMSQMSLLYVWWLLCLLML